MKLKCLLSLCIVTLLTSCGDTNAGKDSKTTASAAPGATPTSGKGTITCLVDGKAVSIIVQNGFFPVILSPDSKGPTDGLELMDGSAKKEGFQFEIKDHGTTNIREGGDNILCIFTYYDRKGAAYVGEDVGVTVISSSSNRLVGTFSGKFKNPIDHKSIAVTEGKFDLIP